MTIVDFIELSDDECYFKVDVIDLSSDEDGVQKDGKVEADDDNVPQSENLAEAATSSPISEPDGTSATPLSMVDNCSTMSSLMADKSMQREKQESLATSDGAKGATQPGNHELIAAGDCVSKAMPSEREAGVFSSTTEQAAATSFLLTEQGAITSSLREDKSIQSGNQVFVAPADCAEEAIQSENAAKAAGSPSMTDGGATSNLHRVGQLCQMIGPRIVGDGLELCISHGGGHPHGEPGSSTVPCTKSEVSIRHQRHSVIRVKGAAGNAMGNTGIYNLHAQEELEGDTEKDENCDFEAEMETLSPPDKEKETSRFGKFYDRKGKKQVDTGYLCHRMQKTFYNGDSGFSIMGNVRNGTAKIGINVLGGEAVMGTYQGCSKTTQGNTTYGKVRDSGVEGCMFQGCTNGAHGVKSLCILHVSRLHKRCCAVTGCTKIACGSSQGHTDRCKKHGGGKRCKYDGFGKGARGNTDFCIAHGGGRRCEFEGCGNSARGRSDYCIKHGGGKCCKFQGCRKSARGRCDYCIKHGGGKRCNFPGCSANATCGTDFCSMHRTSLLNGNSSGHEMLPAPVHQANKSEPSKRKNSGSVIEGRSQKRQNTNDYIDTVVETGLEKGRVFVCQNNMLKVQRVKKSCTYHSLGRVGHV